MADQQAPRDANQVTALLAIDDVTGETVPVPCDADGNLLIVASGGSNSPGGADTNVQFNDGGTFGGDSGFTYNKTTDVVTVAGAVNMETANIEDSDSSHYLVIKTTSNLTANRNFTIVPGDAARTLTMAGNITTAADFITSGANSLTLTTGGATNVTLPATGTLATLAGSEALTNKTVNGLTITSSTGSLTITNAKTLSILKTMSFTAADDTGVYTLPTGTKTLVATDVSTLSSLVSIGTISTGVWNGTAVTVPYGGSGLTSTTAYAVLCGGTTSTGALQSIAGVGTSGQVLTSNGASALPTFQAASGGTTVSTYFPKAMYLSGSTVYNTTSMGTNTIGYVAAFFLPFSIVVNKLSLQPSAVAVTGTYKVGIYTEDGQTKSIDITTGSISAAGIITTPIVTTAVSSVTLTPGVYWIVIVPISTASATFYTWDNQGLLSFGISSEPIYDGRLAVSAGTLPDTFNPVSDITATGVNGALVRFDT